MKKFNVILMSLVFVISSVVITIAKPIPLDGMPAGYWGTWNLGNGTVHITKYKFVIKGPSGEILQNQNYVKVFFENGKIYFSLEENTNIFSVQKIGNACEFIVMDSDGNVTQRHYCHRG